MVFLHSSGHFEPLSTEMRVRRMPYHRRLPQECGIYASMNGSLRELAKVDRRKLDTPIR